jgi:growth arrest-specific protein 8
MEEMEERHQVEIKVYKQKVKHLLYEHQNNLSLQKVDVEYALKLQQEDAKGREDELDRDKRRLKQEIKEREFADQQHVLEMQRDHAKEITKLRQAFEQQACTQVSLCCR